MRVEFQTERIEDAALARAVRRIDGNVKRLADGTLENTVAAIPSGVLTAGPEIGNDITCAFQAIDGRGRDLAGRHMVWWNLDDTDMGAAETPQAPVVVYEKGDEWYQIVANKKAGAFTDSSGRLVLTVTLAGATELYLMCSVGGKVQRVRLIFT